jgi:hypothetical protein
MDYLKNKDYDTIIEYLGSGYRLSIKEVKECIE